MSQSAYGPLILAVSAAGLTKNVSRSGFHRLGGATVLNILTDAGLWVGPRAILETRDDFRQIIPYLVLTDGDRIVCYERTAAGGEKRLHGKLSIGLGGHIDFPDVVRAHDSIDLNRTMAGSAERELDEELGLALKTAPDWIGMIVEHDTPVSRVHIGVVAIAQVDTRAIGAAEDAIGAIRFMTPEELEPEAHRLESWSQRLLPVIRELQSSCRSPRRVAVA